MTIKFSNAPSEFATILKKRVYAYFDEHNLKHTGNTRLYFKTIVLVLMAIACYCMLVFSSLSFWLLFPVALLLGLLLASIGFNVMHDGAHGSYSSKTWVNKLMAYSLNMMGGSSYFWRQKHNIQHHSFTNIEGHDDDIDIRPWIRTNEHQDKKWYHRYQHMYWVFLYGLTYLSWVFSKDFEKYFTGKIAGRKIKTMSFGEHVIFWLTKLVYVILFMAIPIIKIGALKAMSIYVITAFSCGWTISVIFQLAHIVEDASFPKPCEKANKIEENWVVHQLTTTANFSTKSKIISWFAGGLNFQIEHHLFPKISHIHYPQISKLIKETCEQYNIQYMEHPTIWSAIKSHVKYLRVIGVA
jgi:linoleoyl-CoA desaturase